MCRERNKNGHIAIDPVENGFIISITKPLQRYPSIFARPVLKNPNPDIENMEEMLGEDFDPNFDRSPIQTQIFVAKTYEEVLDVLKEQKALLDKPPVKKADKSLAVG